MRKMAIHGLPAQRQLPMKTSEVNLRAMLCALDSVGHVADELLMPCARHLDRDYLSLMLALEAERMRGLVERWAERPPRLCEQGAPAVVVSELMHAVEIIGARRAQSGGFVFRTNLIAPLPWAFDLPFRETVDVCCAAIEEAMVAGRRGIVTFSLEYAADEGSLHVVVADSRRVRRGSRRGLAMPESSPVLAEAVRRLGGEVRSERGEVSGFVQSISLPTVPLDAFNVTAGDIGRLPKLASPERLQASYSRDPRGGRFAARSPACALIVEPNGITRMNLARLLRARGLMAVGVSFGRRVPAFMRARQVDLLVIDLEDEGLRSPDWWRELTHSGFRGAILGLAAHGHDLGGAFTQQIPLVIRKPIERSALDAALNRSGILRNEESPVRYARSSSGAETPASDSELELLIREYTARLPGVVSSLDRAASRGELATVRAELHRLRAATLFGYPKVSELARLMELDLSAARTTEFNAHLGALGRLVGDLGRGPSPDGVEKR